MANPPPLPKPEDERRKYKRQERNEPSAFEIQRNMIKGQEMRIKSNKSAQVRALTLKMQEEQQLKKEERSFRTKREKFDFIQCKSSNYTISKLSKDGAGEEALDSSLKLKKTYTTVLTKANITDPEIIVL